LSDCGEFGLASPTCEKSKQTWENQHLSNLKENTATLSMIRTKASLAKQVNADTSFQVIKFDGKKTKLPKTRPPNAKDGNKSESEDSEFERVFGDGPKRKKSKKDKKDVTFQSARREIINFGIAGSDRNSKTDLNQQLAIKLGAKPPKNVGRNYKEIFEEKQQQKKEQNAINTRTVFGTSASLQYRSQKRKGSQKKDGLLKRYGKVEKDSHQKVAGIKRKR
jgi:Domain of unknown function (DUF4602)